MVDRCCPTKALLSLLFESRPLYIFNHYIILRLFDLHLMEMRKSLACASGTFEVNYFRIFSISYKRPWKLIIFSQRYYRIELLVEEVDMLVFAIGVRNHLTEWWWTNMWDFIISLNLAGQLWRPQMGQNALLRPGSDSLWVNMTALPYLGHFSKLSPFNMVMVDDMNPNIQIFRFLVFSCSWILEIMETFFKAPHSVVWPFKVTRSGRWRSLVLIEFNLCLTCE